jgi:predicted RNase H-like HicB family nuclease
MRTFKVVIEQDAQGRWTLTVPALPGYVACGESEEEVLALAREGIPFHVECLRDEGRPVPDAEGQAKVVELEVAA